MLHIFSPQACLLQVCLTIGLTDAQVKQRQEMIQHQSDALARWSQVGNVLEPHTTYRLKVVTRLQAQGVGELASYSQDLLQTEFVYFRTEGPPGLTTLSVPINYPAPDEFDSGLSDLTRYVRQTIPATVPRIGEKPLLTRPVYRAYDVGVAFNEDYVDLMYRLEGRNLGLYLYDNNNQPVRDSQGEVIVLNNNWGTEEQLTLTESEQRWVSVIDASGCLTLETETIPHAVTLTSSAQGLVLSPDTVYEARLFPLLPHEDFQSATAPVVYRFAFTTSRFANFFHMLHSFQDETWQMQLDASMNVASLLAQAVSPDTSPSPEEALAYEALASQVLSQASVPQLLNLQVTRIKQGEKTLTLLAQSPEPIDWARTDLAVKRAVNSSISCSVPQTLKLTNVTFGVTQPDEESVTLLVREATDLSEYSIEYRADAQSGTAPTWVPYYIFGSETLLPAGIRVRIFSGNEADAPAGEPGVVRRFCAPAGGHGHLPFSTQSGGVTLRLLGPQKQEVHTRCFPPESAYTPIDAHVLRKADGTAFFLTIPTSSTQVTQGSNASYRLEMTYRRNNQLNDPTSMIFSEAGNSATEQGKIDISWG